MPFQKGKLNPKWKGGRVVRDGYWKIWISEEKRYVAEHRLIAERVLGRKLKKGEEVHHINGIKLDNRNFNLLICYWWYHKMLEKRMAYLYQMLVFQGGYDGN